MLDRVSHDVHDLLHHQSSSSVIFAGILTNGVFFAKRVQSTLKTLGYDIQTPVMELDVSLYRDDFASKRDYMSVFTSTARLNLDDQHVVLFDDVLSTARTARAALNAIFDYGRPKQVSFVVLFDRRNRQIPIEPNVVGECLDIGFEHRVNVEFLKWLVMIVLCWVPCLNVMDARIFLE